MTEALIFYVCRTADHQQPVLADRDDMSTSPVTFHEGEWAFCPCGASSGHAWEQVSGTPIHEIRVRLAEVRRS